MNLKRLLASLLVTATLCTLCFAAPAASAAVGFSDIPSATVAQAAETLRLMGVVDGTGNGLFRPDGTLTRGEFCKMAVMILGKGEEAAAQENRTIFNDVRGDHWARGYINLAASTTLGGSAGSDGKPATGDKLMMGRGDGSFAPNANITYAEAVTIMMRMLGYTAAEIATGANWYDGYLATAHAIKLTQGVVLPWDAVMTRGQAALLFHNLLFTNTKGTTNLYLTTVGGSVAKEAVLLSVNATADDGTTGAIGTTEAIYKTNHVPFDPALEGLRVELVLDKDKKVIAIHPNEKGSRRTVSAIEREATYITTSAGEKLLVEPATVVYKGGKATDYKSVYVDLKVGAQMTFHYGSTGKLEYIFLPTANVAASAMVAVAGGGNPFTPLLAGETNYRIVKNGVTATAGDIRQYDVATYDKATRTLNVSDLRLTGVYQNVAPSPLTPLAVTVLGATFPVLTSASDDLANFKIGQTITLLLTADGQVAGALPATTAASTTVGVVSFGAGSTVATVTPLADIRDTTGKKVTLTGETNLSVHAAEQMQGQLVTVSSTKVGQLSLARLTASGAKGALNVAARTVGTVPLSDNVYLYERVGTSVPNQITFAQLTRATVPAAKILYAGTDYAGNINMLVLDDVTGDQYTYGIATLGVKEGFFGGDSYSNTTVTVKNGTQDLTLISGLSVKDKSYIGAAPSLNKLDGTPKAAAIVTLTAVPGVRRSAFDMEQQTAVAGALLLPISKNVVCYNETTKTFFPSLAEARAYSDDLTVYYDRTPQDGGKVRLVVVK